MTDRGDVPDEILDRLRAICLALPETHEETAWVGVRWRIRQRTFAHVLIARPDHEMAYARAAGSTEPLCLMSFRAPGEEVAALVARGRPFFKPDWSPNVIGMVFEDPVDWREVAELLTDSYCVMAPKRLAAQVTTPPA